MKNVIYKIALAVLAVILVAVVFVISTDDIHLDKIKAVINSCRTDDSFADDNYPMSTYFFDTLDEKEKTAYISIFNRIKEHPVYIRVPKLTKDQFNRVFFAVKNDNPDILCFADSCNMITYLDLCLIKTEYINDKAKCNEMMNEVAVKIKEIAAGVPSGYDDYEKELYIHDYIVANCSYTECENDSNIYGCLIEGNAVCSGYARSAMVLLNTCGIRSVLVGGKGISPQQGETGHMWNVVWIGGKPYQLDVTWDDPANTDDAFGSHMYFNTTVKDVENDHLEHDPYIECTDTDANYFVKTGMFFDTYDNGVLLSIEKKLTENINNGVYYIEFRFSNAEAYETAVGNMTGNDDNSDIYNILRYIDNNTGGIIDVSHVNFSKDENMKYIKLMFDPK